MNDYKHNSSLTIDYFNCGFITKKSLLLEKQPSFGGPFYFDEHNTLMQPERVSSYIISSTPKMTLSFRFVMCFKKSMPLSKCNASIEGHIVLFPACITISQGECLSPDPRITTVFTVGGLKKLIKLFPALQNEHIPNAEVTAARLLLMFGIVRMNLIADGCNRKCRVSVDLPGKLRGVVFVELWSS